MKKLFLALFLLLNAATSSLLSMQHIPATGLIELNGTATQPGIILDIILNDINFQEERDTLINFSQNLQNPTYQNIVTLIKNYNGCLEGGLEILEAFERAIMYNIHQKNYITYIENKYLNIFITGIRWSWITPGEWTRCWYKENSYMVHQCMKELSALADITKKYSTTSSARMKATVESYLNWRRNTLITISTYLLANGFLRRDTKKSPLTMLINGGLKNIPNTIDQVKDDIVDFTTTIGNYIMPIGNRIFNGRQTSTNDKNTTAKTIVPVSTNSTKSKENSPSNYSQLKTKIKDYNQILNDKFLYKKTKTEQPLSSIGQSVEKKEEAKPLNRIELLHRHFPNKKASTKIQETKNIQEAETIQQPIEIKPSPYEQTKEEKSYFKNSFFKATQPIFEQIAKSKDHQY